MGLFRTLLLWGSENEWLRNTAPKIFFVRKATSRFMPGEKLQAAIDAAKELKTKRLATVFTHLGENLKDMEEATRVTEHYLEVLKEVDAAGIDTEISLKLTQIGLDLDPEQTYQNFRKITEAATKYNNFVWIDIEGSFYTQVTVDFYERAKKEFPNVGLCLQAYLYRTDKDIDKLLALSPAIRLVKGAYNEPEDIAFPEKKAVDDNYLKLSRQMLAGAKKNGVRAAFATHDTKLISQIVESAKELEIPEEKLEFQMLYGIMPGEQARLVEKGHDVRILISYGEFWFPWYMRRLAERPANVLFVLKNLFAK